MGLISYLIAIKSIFNATFAIVPTLRYIQWPVIQGLIGVQIELLYLQISIHNLLLYYFCG